MSINGFICGGCGAAYPNLGDFWAHLSAAHRIPVQSSPTPYQKAPAPVQRVTAPAERPWSARHTKGTLPACTRCGKTTESATPGYGARFRSADGLCAACDFADITRRVQERQRRRAS